VKGEGMVETRDSITLTDAGLKDTDFTLIINEDCDQISKWGFQCHDIFQWLAFTTEELGELSEAISEYYFRDGDAKAIVKEATQTATLALKLAVMAREQL